MLCTLNALRQFSKYRLLYFNTKTIPQNYWLFGRWTKSKNPIILSIIHHHQNPSESNKAVSVAL
jgi:hypothetical protein